MPAGDAVSRPIFVKLTDGTEVANIDASNRQETSVLNVKPDGSNAMPSMDAAGRAGFQKITNGTDVAVIDLDDDNISANQKTLMVINLNYVYDGANQKWVRQTPSSIIWNWNALDNDVVSTAGTWTTADDSGDWLGRHLINTTHTQNDRAGLGSIYIPQTGNYTMYGIFIKGTHEGIAHFYLNGVDKGEIDLYAASGSNNNSESVSLGSLTAGLYEIEIRVDDKNASSDNYYCRPHSLALASD